MGNPAERRPFRNRRTYAGRVSGAYDRRIESRSFSYQDSASVFTGPCFPTASTVVYGTSLGQLKCLDINTKRVLWATPEGPTIYSTPFVGAGVVVVGHVDGEVAGYNRKNGKKIWSFNIGSPVVGDGVADENGYGYIGGSFGEFVKFNCKNGRVEWKKKIGEGLIQAKPVISDNKIIFGCWDKYLYCVDRNDGSVIWKWTNGSPQKLYSPRQRSPRGKQWKGVHSGARPGR